MSFTVRVKEELLLSSDLKRVNWRHYQDVWKSWDFNGGLTPRWRQKMPRSLAISMNCCIISMRPNRISATTKRPIWKKSCLHSILGWKGGRDSCWLAFGRCLFGIETGIDASVLEDEVASRAYLRGSLSVEWFHQGSWKREIPAGNSFCLYRPRGRNCPSYARIFTRCETIERKKGVVTHLQRAKIHWFSPRQVEAMQAMQEFESIKVMRETRNDLNRANNAEMANIQRHSYR